MGLCNIAYSSRRMNMSPKGPLYKLSSMEIWCELPAKSVRPNYFYDVVIRRPFFKDSGFATFVFYQSAYQEAQKYLSTNFP